MSDNGKKNRRLFLKSAAAMGLAGVGAKAAAQDIQRMPRPTIRDRVVTPVRGTVSQNRNLGMVGLRQGMTGLSIEAESLLRNDSLIPDSEVEGTVSLVREMVAGLDSNFSGMVRIDLAFGVNGDPRLFNCGNNTCGGHTCGSHTCGTNNCGSQTCGTNTCSSNVSITNGNLSEIPRSSRRQWQVMQQMHREMDNRYIELNVIQVE
ncbi:hypothetical protein V0U79_06240 [Hyphobacterium sp. HN65]|uniref:Twin-arginine translocation signal domain-containing protein n=1 Tax=Hyphobacterium lacteum TaxID=3116575 RepID=A0ABU7LRK4_9PROT|nr:hypothetical protein [Hyphobacterium sp. HN65]MEE2525959.1 hypothetical protein [Hyphobacterium sp. HN65]